MRKECLVCGIEYQSPHKKSKYCTHSCYAEARKQGLYGKVVWTEEMKSRMSARHSGEGNPMYGKAGHWLGKARENMRGSKHPRYRGGWIQAGYKFVRDKNREISLQRKIMQEHLGRELTANEVVHHINRNKQDNRLENLQVLTRAEHIEIHRKDLK